MFFCFGFIDSKIEFLELWCVWAHRAYGWLRLIRPNYCYHNIMPQPYYNINERKLTMRRTLQCYVLCNPGYNATYYATHATMLRAFYCSPRVPTHNTATKAGSDKAHIIHFFAIVSIAGIITCHYPVSITINKTSLYLPSSYPARPAMGNACSCLGRSKTGTVAPKLNRRLSDIKSGQSTSENTSDMSSEKVRQIYVF